jgi:rsbT antagonist protein RsbS
MTRASLLTVEQILIVTLHDDPTFAEAADLLTQVGDMIVGRSARGLLVDTSGLSLVDSHTARVLGGLIGTAGLLGAEAVIVGIRPEVAITMVELGIELPGVATALNVDLGLAALRARIELRA